MSSKTSWWTIILVWAAVAILLSGCAESKTITVEVQEQFYSELDGSYIEALVRCVSHPTITFLTKEAPYEVGTVFNLSLNVRWISDEKETPEYRYCEKVDAN